MDYELAKLLCLRGELELGCRNAAGARTILAEVEMLAARIGVGPESELALTLGKLRRKVEDVRNPART